MSAVAWFVALGRVLEARARRSTRVRRLSRRAVAAVARRSREVRAVVRLRLMHLV